MALIFCAPLAWSERPGERAHGPAKVEGIDQEEGRRIMEEFRHQRLRGDFVFLFDLVHRPRRDKDVVYQGIMWGTWNSEGSLSRVSVWPKGKRETNTRELIVQGGPEPEVWMLRDGKVVELTKEEQGEPFFPEMVYTPYDVVMPFAYWDLFEYTDSKRLARGRPVHMFMLYAPADVAQRIPELAAVELALDASFNAPLTAKMLDIDSKPLRTLDVGGFKEIDDQYIVKEIDLIDERSGDKTRFRVTGAAVNLDLSPQIFKPEELKQGEPDITKIIFEPV
ncbi:outer membrane lipoprotein-sorting protein [Cerasicoccus arenae]|uniref:outer membrane lipoprotein-sorting protein n=1 Tax=Cerasicoccus arenae TaxID=424488 RepID=UPI00167B0C6C|nr:outer membrane lipoprotein-sorting protein [Cerasicoccus arenae]MBK1857539.1 outer membrane lipoprotein-sorting protein [Cerasicoccus arenae]